MKNQSLFIAILASLLLRHSVPYVDIFIVFLVIQLLLHPDKVQIISLFSVLASFLASFLFDSPLGLLPLVLAGCLFLFGFLFERFSNKGLSNIAIWSVFVAVFIVLEQTLRVTLAVGAFTLPPAGISTAVCTLLTIYAVSFWLSFRKKI